MPEGSHRFQVGSISCTVLTDGYYSYPASWFFPNAAPEDLTRALESHHLPTDAVLSPYTCLLIETGRHVVLVDTGAGEYSRSSGAIQARLEVAGIRPKDVDTVILTHAHPDHIGGAIDLFGRPAFPNARYVLSELEWEFWTTARSDLSRLRLPDVAKESIVSMARRCLGPLRHQIEPIERETEIVPGVVAIPAPGTRQATWPSCLPRKANNCSIWAMLRFTRSTWSSRPGRMVSTSLPTVPSSPGANLWSAPWPPTCT
jgi:metallo-beta-lactamase superfamily protein